MLAPIVTGVAANLLLSGVPRVRQKRGMRMPPARTLTASNELPSGEAQGMIAIVRRVTIATLLLVTSGFLAQLRPAHAAADQLPLVYVLATGGTISGKGATPTSLTEYRSGTLLGDELVAAVPAIADVARVRVEQVANLSSTDITIAHWLTLARRINQIFDTDPGVAGVVITHGTNTLEETAYFLNLTVRHDRPVVLVGAMRPATALSADGPLNLLSAVRTAVAPEARGKGALVVLNDEINGARDVTKTSTYRVETFQAPELGLLGYVDGDQVSFYRSSTRRHTASSEFDVRELADLPRADILYSYVEPATTLAKALVDSGVAGIVIAGTGAGGMSSRERDALLPLLALPEGRRPVIVRSSRTGSGRVVGTAEYDRLGLIPADTLSPQKARILLMLALSKTRNVNEIRRMFREY
ncbi:MAG: asparaginase [Acidobacteriota bacterium]